MDNIEPSQARAKGAEHSTRTLWRDIILLAISYYVAGLIGTSLAVPPGYATIVWPASGVALCALLARGSARWPGIWIGSFVFNASIGLEDTAALGVTWQALAIAAAVATGSTLQGLVGFRMARGFVDGIELSDLRSVGRSMSLAVFLPCLISPTIGVIALLLSGKIGLDLTWINWSTWYFGDLLGVLLILPILLFSRRSPISVSWHGRVLQGIQSLVVISLGATLLLTLYAWKFISEQEYDRTENSFSTMASDTEEALRHRLQVYQRGMQSAAAFVASSDDLTAADWREYVRRLDLARAYPGMRGMGLFNQADSGDLPALAARMQAEYGSEVEIHPPVDRGTHYVITRIEPLAANYAALGLDLAFEEGRREAIRLSLSRSEAVLTRPIVLVQDARQGAGFLLLLPVRDQDGRPTGQWIYAPLVAEELLASLTPAQGTDFALEVSHGVPGASEKAIFASGQIPENPRFQREQAITLAGQPMVMRWSSLAPFVNRTSSAAPALAVGSGLMITLLLAVLLVTFLRRESHVTSEVERATAELAEQNRMLEMAEATAQIGHWHLDTASNKVRWSDEVYRLHGLEIGNEPELERAIEFFHPDDRPLVEKSLASAMESGKPYEFRAQLIGAGGEMRHVEVRGQVQKEDDGEVSAVFGVIIDRTEETLMRERLTHSIEEARSADKAKTSFLANMSHEIRTPMNGVIGFTELALSAETDPDQKRRLQMIADSGNAMLRLLNDLLDFAKIEAKQMAIVKESVDLRHALRSCQRLMEPVARGQGLDLILDIDPRLPARVMIDKMRLRQIVLNLVGNALKFTGEGTVTISAVPDPQDQGKFSIAVEDTGIGIPEDRLESIFGKFTQADDTTAREYGGTGLGLPISAELAELMGGTLSARSVSGEGSTFTLTLPLEEGHPVEETNSASQFDEGDGAEKAERLVILVAEDNPVNQELTIAMVDRAGHDCILARDGREAVDRVIQAEKELKPFDMVLMDMQMPRLDGLEATRMIRAAGIDAERLPIIAITANAYADDIERCKEAGMQAHLAKPLKLKSLRSAIAEWSPAAADEPEAEAQVQAQAQSVGEEPAEEAFEQETNPRLKAMFEERVTLVRAEIDRVLAKGRVEDAEREEISGLLHQIAGVAAYFGKDSFGVFCREKSHELRDHTSGEETLGVLNGVKEQLAISFG